MLDSLKEKGALLFIYLFPLLLQNTEGGSKRFLVKTLHYNDLILNFLS